jgi:hypothetical protein
MLRPSLVVAFALAWLAGIPAAAQTERQLQAHEHGHSTLNLAVEGGTLLIEFIAPGADIVGFEHRAKSKHDKAKVREAMAVLSKPLALFVPPDAAGCTVLTATVELEGGDGDDHGHDHGSKSGDAKAKAATDEPHNEFHAEYSLQCTAVDQLTELRVRVFEAFPNAREIAATVLSAKGQRAADLTADKAVLDLRGLR